MEYLGSGLRLTPSDWGSQGPTRCWPGLGRRTPWGGPWKRPRRPPWVAGPQEALWTGSLGSFLNGNSFKKKHSFPIGSMYAIYGNIYHQYTPNVSIYTIHGSYGCKKKTCVCHHLLRISKFNIFQHISTSHSLPEVPLLIAQLAHGPEEAAQLLLSTSQYRLSRPAEGHQQRHIAPG